MVTDFYADPPTEEAKEIPDDTHSQALNALHMGMERRPFSVLRETLKDRGPGDVASEVQVSRLAGCGGAHFPVAQKWSLIMDQAPERKRVLVVNGQEGETDSFKDRFLMGFAPQLVVEGASLAAFAIEASTVKIVIGPGMTAENEAMEEAIEDLGRQFSKLPFTVELVVGPGLYISGEESALISFLEGERGEPRKRPPFPAQSGVDGEPTLVHNVETVAWLPTLLKGGGRRFLERGPPKLVSVSGDVLRPNVFVVSAATTVEEAVALGGGFSGAGAVQAFAIGGPSGGFLPASAGSLRLCETDLREAGAGLGSGSLRVIGERSCLLTEFGKTIDFLSRQSCGRCAPCRVGSGVLGELCQRLRRGDGDEGCLTEIGEVATAMASASFCGLGQAAPRQLRSIERYWPNLLARHHGENGCERCRQAA